MQDSGRFHCVPKSRQGLTSLSPTRNRCIRPQVFSDHRSNFGPFVPLDADTPVTLVFEQHADKSGWTQSAIVNGQTVTQVSIISKYLQNPGYYSNFSSTFHQISFPSGPMTLFGVTTECDDYCDMTISPQTYTNTVIELEDPDGSWQSTSVVGSQVYGDGTINTTGQKATVVEGMSSSEGGKIWSVDQIMIPPLN